MTPYCWHGDFDSTYTTGESYQYHYSRTLSYISADIGRPLATKEKWQQSPYYKWAERKTRSK